MKFWKTCFISLAALAAIFWGAERASRINSGASVTTAENVKNFTDQNTAAKESAADLPANSEIAKNKTITETVSPNKEVRTKPEAVMEEALSLAPETASGEAARASAEAEEAGAAKAFLEECLRVVAEISRKFAAADGNALSSHENSENLSKSAKEGAEREDGIFQGKVEKGDTIGKVLENAGSGSVQHYVRAAGKVFSLRSFREGQSYVIITDGVSGRVKRFEYEINDARRLVIEGVERPEARLEKIEYITLLETAEGVINDNLFQSVADIGESPQLALRLVDLFGSEINFIRDIQDGDSFSVLLEKRYRNDEYKGYGRILAATFVNNGKTYEAFLFRDQNGKAQHYNARGENLHKTLLQAPLAVTRVTSRFTHSRRHPILGENRPHLGVDYGAPTGTPVKAVGEGTVVRRGWAGGYGNQIVIRHGAGLESMYAHLSGYARGLRQGQRVKQGQVIGFVGSTGMSTGPHLDFRLRQNGKFINPAKAINPRGAPVSAKMMPRFKRTVSLAREYLAGRKSTENYTVDSIVPRNVSFQEDKPAKAASARKGKKTEKRKKASKSGRSQRNKKRS